MTVCETGDWIIGQHSAAICLSVCRLQLTLNIGLDDENKLDPGAYFCTRLNLHLKGIFQVLYTYFPFLVLDNTTLMQLAWQSFS
jgi:hypothetical protein